MIRLSDIVEALTGRVLDSDDYVVTDAVVDSRQVIPGSLFIAMEGENTDGHQFVKEAVERGASFALIEKSIDDQVPTINCKKDAEPAVLPPGDPPFYILVENTLTALQEIARFWRSKLDIRVIGITGSVGKSTSKELIASVLEQRYRTLKNFGNLNNEIGLPLSILKLTKGHEYAVLEMGLYVEGEIALLCDISKPQIGVVTNIGTVHAERAGSRDALARGKAELVEALPEDPYGVAILNFDDPLVRDMALKTRAKIFSYGIEPGLDLWADGIEGLGLEGIRLRLHYENESYHIKVPLIGRHSVHTVLRTAAVGIIENLSWEEIINGLKSGHAQLRLVAVRSGNGALLLDDTYNASPQSMIAALNLLGEIPGRKIAVLGDMLELGQYERQGHVLVGRRAADVADLLITIGERAKLIADSAKQVGFPGKNLIHSDDNQTVIEYLGTILTEKDNVLVKGSRDMRMDTIVSALENLT